MGKTKKVGITGRLGARYGVKIRKRLKKVEKHKGKKHKCPNCEKNAVERLAAGLYYCSKCQLKFTGGAYAPETMTGRIVKRIVSQKEFVPEIKELIELQEEKEKQ